MQCPKCGATIRDDVHFCTTCGAALVDPAAEFSVPASGLVYLFGEQFVEQARLTGETLLVSGVKVKQRELAQTCYLAAFLALDREGAIQLRVGKRRRALALFKARAVLAHALRDETGFPGLEAELFHLLVRAGGETDVGRLIWQQLGTDLSSPWATAINGVKQGLAELGCLDAQREARSGMGRILGDRVTMVPVQDRIASLAGEAGEVQAMIATFQTARHDVFAQLQKDIARGFASRREDADYD
jgi:hypothetical protein